MVSVKSISELRISDDYSYSLIGDCSSVSVYFDSPSGEVEIGGVEAFKHADGTLLRFDNTKIISSGTPWSLRAMTDTGDSFLLHWLTYEEQFEVWEQKTSFPHTFYTLMKSVNTNVINQDQAIRKNDLRCDDTMYGPTIYTTCFDGIKPTPFDLDLFRDNNIGNVNPPVGVNGVGHIVSMNVHGINMSWRNWPMVTLAAKTFSGMLKLMTEWRSAHLAGISDDDFAIDSTNLLNALGITEEMINELKETEVVMPVERFFLGYGNPRHGFEETGVLPESIKSHFMSQLRYKNLSTLEAKHPAHPSFNSTLKDEELDKRKYDVLIMVRVSMPERDPFSITPDDVYRRYYLSERGNGYAPPSIPELEIYNKGLWAARFFDAISE